MTEQIQKTDTQNREIEEVFQELDTIAEKLESGDTSLEDSFRLYKKGMELLKYCSDRLDTVEKKMLQMDEDGTLREFYRRITAENRLCRRSDPQMASGRTWIFQNDGTGDELQHVCRRQETEADPSSGDSSIIWRG